MTEGGLKAAVAQSLVEKESGWFVAISGVSCFTVWAYLVRYLKDNGVTTLVDEFDSECKTNPNVAHSIDKLYEIAEEMGLKMTPWEIDPAYKGVDDFLFAKKQRKN